MTKRSSSTLTADDLHFFNEGTHTSLGEVLGGRLGERDGVDGVQFTVWAPGADHVSVVGDWNGWSRGADVLEPVGGSGIWETFVPGLVQGAIYKFHIGAPSGFSVDKADPYALYAEHRPRTGSIVWDLDYAWADDDWMAGRGQRNALSAPISVYELHLGSWMRGEGNRQLSYLELAPRLVEHCRNMGFTHVELLPVMEHPFDASWGYQTLGYFAPTSRFGTPQEFMALVDALHQGGIGVILDWVPSHFPEDEHGLVYFDGTHLYEHADPRQGFHPDWKSAIFNYGRNEIRAFLISSAMHWLRRYHVDGLRVDAVASMLYLDYSRKDGEWIPNKHGGRENIEAIEFLQQLNTSVYREFPDVQTIAEESTSWGGVSRPTYAGGLGFGMKWDMGWMHDTLHYLQRDPVYRRFHHSEVTFRAVYQFSENFMLPISHDEVVHGKGSLLRKMPGDEWQRFANVRLLLANQWTSPGKKLLFMGCEIAQVDEWKETASIDWHLGDLAPHQGIARLVSELNRVYRELPALHEYDCDGRGFEWVDGSDADHGVVAFLRRGLDPGDVVLVVTNYSNMVHTNYRLGVPAPGFWREVVNTDASVYGGSGVGNLGGAESHPVPWQGQGQSLTLTLPPLAAIVFRKDPA
jgi:1,4-alpha-glucan branching enzyme